MRYDVYKLGRYGTTRNATKRFINKIIVYRELKSLDNCKIKLKTNKSTVTQIMRIGVAATRHLSKSKRKYLRPLLLKL